MSIQPHNSLKYITPDEVAECWDGVISAGLYEPLWACVSNYDNSYRENIEDIGPADVVGINSVASFWGSFSDEQKEALNRLAVAQDEYLRELLGD